MFDPLHVMPCMRCNEGFWEVIYDDGVMEYALCKGCAKIMQEKDEAEKN